MLSALAKNNFFEGNRFESRKKTDQEDSELVFLPLLLQIPDLLGREVRAAAEVGAVDVADHLGPEPVESHLLVTVPNLGPG